jgi:hypothetical protein
VLARTASEKGRRERQKLRSEEHEYMGSSQPLNFSTSYLLVFTEGGATTHAGDRRELQLLVQKATHRLIEGE